MQIKVFYIRLTKEKFQLDQDHLNDFMDKVKVTQVFTELVTGQVNFWSILLFYEAVTDQSVSESIAELSGTEKPVYDALKIWRLDKSREESIAPFMVCSNKVLIRVVKSQPQNIGELLLIKGFANKKVAKYGEEIIAVLNSF